MNDRPSHEPDNLERVHGILRIALFCFTLLLVLAFSIHKIENLDFGWQLKTGQYIYEHREVP